MKKRTVFSNRFLPLLLTGLFFSRVLFAGGLDIGLAQSEDGGRSGSFLDFGLSARSIAMAQAQTASNADASSVYSNPAGLGALDRKDLVSVYSSLYQDTNFAGIGYAQPVTGRGVFGVGLVNLQSSDFKKADATGQRTGTFNNTQSALLLSHGYRWNTFSYGVTGKIIRHEVDVYKASGAGLDLGGQYQTTPVTRIAVVFHNLIQPQLKLRSENERYVRDVRLGFEGQVNPKWSVNFDIMKVEQQNTKFLLGSEYRINDLLALRGGVNEREIATGIGIMLGDWSLDYAFGYQDAVAGVADLGASHRIGFNWKFGSSEKAKLDAMLKNQKTQALLVSLQEKMDAAGETVDPNPSQTAELLSLTQQALDEQWFLSIADEYQARGIFLFLNQQFEKSVESFSQAAALSPTSETHRRNLEKARSSVPPAAVTNFGGHDDYCGPGMDCMKTIHFQSLDKETSTAQ